MMHTVHVRYIDDSEEEFTVQEYTAGTSAISFSTERGCVVIVPFANVKNFIVGHARQAAA